jgi:hypothetical protein
MIWCKLEFSKIYSLNYSKLQEPLHLKLNYSFREYLLCAHVAEYQGLAQVLYYDEHLQRYVLLVVAVGVSLHLPEGSASFQRYRSYRFSRLVS